MLYSHRLIIFQSIYLQCMPGTDWPRDCLCNANNKNTAHEFSVLCVCKDVIAVFFLFAASMHAPQRGYKKYSNVCLACPVLVILFCSK